MQILFGTSLMVNEREIVTIIGSNGSGKTTTLATLSGMIHPKVGEIKFCGERIDHEVPHKIVQLGIVQVPEGRRVFPGMTVSENLELGSFIKRAKVERKRTLEYVLEIFPVLRDKKKQRAGTLSGGEQQMLAIGRALMSLPRLLMLDEPSLGLSPLIVDEIFRVIWKMNELGTTILLVEQNVLQALEISVRAYVYSNGQIVLTGYSKDLVNNSLIKRAYIGTD
jgi:branched-chain amino acid transport system ATP-binding protein